MAALSERSRPAVHRHLDRQHFTHIKLDERSGAPLPDGESICANHGAMFAADTGECTFGPCEGAFLTDPDVTVEDGGVSLIEDDWEFVGVGPIGTAESRGAAPSCPACLAWT